MASFKDSSRRRFLKNAGCLAVGAGLGMGLPSSKGASYAASYREKASVAQALKTWDTVSLQAPSNSTYFLAIVKEKGLDKKYGLDLNVKYYADLSAMYSDLASGKTPSTPSSALYNAANFYTRGVPIQITYTYSTANYAVVTRNPAIKTATDLKGKTIAATTGSGFYGLFILFLSENGMDPRKDVNIINAAPPAVQAQLETDKVDAGAVWEPNLSILLLKGFRTVGDISADIRKNLGMAKDARIWYLGAYSAKKWLDEDPERVMATYRTYKDAEKFFNENQAESIEIISKFTRISKEALKLSIDRKFAEFVVIPAIQEKANIMKTFEGFVKTGFMEKMPDDGLFYPWSGLKT